MTIQKCRHFPVQKEGLDMPKTLIVLHTHLIADEQKISVSRSVACGQGRPVAGVYERWTTERWSAV